MRPSRPTTSLSKPVDSSQEAEGWSVHRGAACNTAPARAAAVLEQAPRARSTWRCSSRSAAALEFPQIAARLLRGHPRRDQGMGRGIGQVGQHMEAVDVAGKAPGDEERRLDGALGVVRLPDRHQDRAIAHPAPLPDRDLPASATSLGGRARGAPLRSPRDRAQHRRDQRPEQHQHGETHDARPRARSTRRSRGSRSESSMDWRNELSAMSPSTSASTIGANGYSSFLKT